MVIRASLSGTHGTGKTTLLDMMKEEEFDKGIWGGWVLVDGPTRRLKDLGFPINNDQSDNYDGTQLMCCHIDLENLAKTPLMNPVLLSDRCLLDTLVYTRYLHGQGKVTDPVMKVIESAWNLHKKDYDLILLPSKDDIELIGDKYRNTDIEFRETIHRMFQAEIIKNKLNAHTVKGTVEDRLDKIVELVNYYIGKES